MKKKRLLIYVALLAVFAIACTVQLTPKLIARAEDCPDAAVGTASLLDAGDTVFVRMAKFTIGEQTIRAPGFVVANAAAGENPAAGVDFSALKPITATDPLTGTLDKDICVVGDNSFTDLYLGDLKLTTGHKLYSKTSGFNLLGGKLSTPKLETPKQIGINSAIVTVDSDLTGFALIDLNVSESTNSRIASFGTPASLTVNGNISNTSTAQSYAIGVNKGSTLTVTGSVTVKRGVHVISKEGYERSTLKIGDDLTVSEGTSGNGLVLVLSDAEIGGAIKTNAYVDVDKGSTLKAKSVEAYMLEAQQGGSFDIEGDVTLSYWLDCYGDWQTGVCRIGGDLKCDLLNVVGKGTDDPEKLTVGGAAECVHVYVFNSELTVGKGLVRTGGSVGVFLIKQSTAEIGGDVSGDKLDLQSATVTIHGNLTGTGYSCLPIKESTLTVDGDAETKFFNPLKSSVIEIKGNLTEKANLFMCNGASLKVGKSASVTGGELGVNDGSKMTVGGDMELKGYNNVLCRGSEVTVTGNLDCCNSGHINPVGSKLTVGGNLINAINIFATDEPSYGGSTIAVNGNVVTSGYFALHPNSTIQTGGDMIYNYQNGLIEGNMIVGRDFVNNFTNYTENFPASYGVLVTGKLQVGRDVQMNTLLLNANSYPENINVTGMIVAHRVTDITKIGGNYVIEGTAYETSEDKFRYTVPFEQQVVTMTIGGENYVADVRDISQKEFTPVKAGASYAITYVTNEGAFRDEAVIAETYYTQFGADLPKASAFVRGTGWVFDGWYKNADFTGSPQIKIPAGMTGDQTFYAKFHECDHVASTAQPTCSETAICSICEMELPVVPHPFTVPVETFDPTCDDGGYTTYKCQFCDETEDRDFVSALGHAYVCDEWVWADDYTSATAKLRCTRCGDTQEPTDDATDQTVVSTQDCTQPEITIFKAEILYYNQTFTESQQIETKPVLGHDDGLWQIDFEATPEHDGQKTRWCTRCGTLLETETFPQHTHVKGFERTLTPATCTEDGEKGLYCELCGALYAVEAIPAAGHDDGVWKVDFEPTADHDGQKTLYCTKCGAALDQETFTAHTHTFGYETVTIPATCTANGEKGKVCALCNAVYEIEVVPATGHTDGAERTLFPATCTADGQKVTCCDVCGEMIQVETIPATGHTAGVERVLTPATCTEAGETGVYCATCGELMEMKPIEATGHDEGVWKVDFDPTPEHDGQKTRYCTKCGAALETEAISAHTHTFGYETVSRKATCTKDGEKGHVCGVCGAVYETEVIPAKGHTEGYQRIVTPATCTEPGVMGTFCATCGERYAVSEIAATGHDFGAWYKNGDGTHSRICGKCGFKETANCNYTATVTEPTCTEEGFTTYVCDDCGYTYVDDYVDPLDHDWGDWIDDENGETHTHTCARCGNAETEAHEFGPWVYNKDAKFFKNGTQTRTCACCGCEETETVPHTSVFARIFVRPILWVLTLIRKAVFTGSFLWYLPWLNIFPKM